MGTMKFIRQNDPTLYQVLIDLIDTVIRAKHAIMKEGSYGIFQT